MSFITVCYIYGHKANTNTIVPEADLPNAKVSPRSKRSQYLARTLLGHLAVRDSTKLEEGIFRVAVQIASSEGTLAPSDEATFAALQDKHPKLHPNSAIPSLQEDFLPYPIPVTAKDIVKAIRSFTNGSVGGPDGLKPQHLKYMICPPVNTLGLLSTLSHFVQLVLEDRTPAPWRPIVFGANLTTLQKSGGVRPIAVGCTLRCLVASDWR